MPASGGSEEHVLDGVGFGKWSVTSHGVVYLVLEAGYQAVDTYEFVTRKTRRLGRLPFTFLLSFPFFWLIDTRKPALIWLAMSVWIFAVDGLWSVMGIFIAELFPAQVRYSGVSLGYNMVGILGGAPAPVIATALIQWTGGASWPVATYLAANSFISLVAVYLASEKYRVGIHNQPSVDQRLIASADGNSSDRVYKATS